MGPRAAHIRDVSLLPGFAVAVLPCRWTVSATVVEPATGSALIHKPILLRQTMWLRVEAR